MNIKILFFRLTSIKSLIHFTKKKLSFKLFFSCIFPSTFVIFLQNLKNGLKDKFRVKYVKKKKKIIKN